MWAEAPLNEEIAEPFLLLSNCMLLCLGFRERLRERARGNKVLPLDLIGALFPLLAFSSPPCTALACGLCPFKLGRPWRGHTMERRAYGNWAVVLLRGGWGRERTGSHS